MNFKRSLSLTLAVIILASCTAGFSATAVRDYSAYASKLDKTVYSGELGAIYTKKSTTFRVWAPNSDSVKVKFYKSGNSKKYTKITGMKKNKRTGVWSVRIKGNLKNTYYTYSIKRGRDTIETSDIYAKACGVNGEKSMVADLASTNPEGWQEDKHITVDTPTDAKIWEIQIADFSSSPTSGVSGDNRGKYLAFTEKGTTVNGISQGASTCVDYLKALGVNYVQINPFYDFGSVDETDDSGKDGNYNWGYDPVNYNCPEGSYSSDPYHGEVRIKECKQMIQALHNAGIGVIMDVVYNHTLKDKDSNFNLTVPDYYYRINPDGSWSNGSGCGNDTASERKMFRKYMIDSVLYWAEEYHIDGFRFDLMGLHDVDTMNAVRSALDGLDGGEKLIMYGEAWNLTTTADEGAVLANQNNISKLNLRIGAFDDTYRDAVKGSTSGADQGFLQSGSGKAKLKIGISGQADKITGWAKAPTQTVTYASCHDNLTLWDKLVKSVKGSKGKYGVRYNDLVAMNKLAGAITYTSQGISFMLAGEEFCRTKQGDENSYSSGTALNQIDWTYLETYGDVSDYYRGLMEIRSNISAFTDSTAETACNINYLPDMPTGVLAYTVNDPVYGKVLVIFNSSENNVQIKAQGSWVQLADEEVAGMKSLGTVINKVKVAPCGAAILVEKDKYNSSKPASDSGKVIVRYYSDGELFKSYTQNGKVGESYSVSALQSVLMDYNIKKRSGDSGTFSDSVRYCDFQCEKYSGGYSGVTFKFVDDSTDRGICDFMVMTNRQGQEYRTPNIPSVDGYLLNLDKLPKNGCGVFSKKDKTVKYRYTKKTSADTGCRVNIIYMASDGKILGTDTIMGEEGDSYSTSEIEFESYKFSSATDNSKGSFTLTEQNVLYIYDSVSLIFRITVAVSVLCAVIIVGVIAFVGYGRKKKRLMERLDIRK